MNISKFISRLPGAKKNGKGWIALCPAHDDQHASLSVGIGDDGRILLKCFAGCDTDSIVKALGIHISDLFSNGAVQMNGQRKRDWPALAKIFSDALTPDRRAELAKVLGLPELALASLAIGWSEAEQCWTFPECNGQGQIIGINRRYRDGQKKAIAGSKRGLTVPENWRQGEGPIFLPEGASNTLSLIALGLHRRGRSSRRVVPTVASQAAAHCPGRQ